MHVVNANQSLCGFRQLLWLLVSLFCSLLVAPAMGADSVAGKASTDVVYKLSPFDLVLFSVYGQEELGSEQRITDQGHLSIPLLGEVAVGGLTVSEAANLIEASFVKEEYLRRPVITISIKEFAPKVVTVLGEVEKPGSVEIPPGRNGIPVQIAIAGAGGFTGTAKITEVRVSAGSSERGGQSQSMVVNMSKLLDSKAELKEGDLFMVHPDDIIFVPRRVF